MPALDGTGERFIGTPRIQNGKVFFATFNPTGDSCLPGGLNLLYGLDLISGSGSLTNVTQLPTNSPVSSTEGTGAVPLTSGAPVTSIGVLATNGRSDADLVPGVGRLPWTWPDVRAMPGGDLSGCAGPAKALRTTILATIEVMETWHDERQASRCDRPTAPGTHAPRSRGFTLIELMVVVADRRDPGGHRDAVVSGFGPQGPARTGESRSGRACATCGALLTVNNTYAGFWATGQPASPVTAQARRRTCTTLVMPGHDTAEHSR